MIALWVLIAILIAHTVVFRAATRWTRKGWRVDVYEWQARIARPLLGLPTVTPPWYVRYADWLGRVARRPPRVTGQVVLELEVVIPRASRPVPLAGSAHVLPKALDVGRHYSHVHWAMAGDGELRPVPLDGGIHPALFDEGGHLPPGEHRVTNASRRPEPVLTAEQWGRVVAPMRDAFDQMVAAFRNAFHDVDVLMRELDPIYGHRRRRQERLAAKRPEQTALWTAYRHKTRRRNRRRRNR